MKLKEFLSSLLARVKSGVQRFLPTAVYTAAFFCVFAWSIYNNFNYTDCALLSLALIGELAVLARLVFESRGRQSRATGLTFAITLPLGALVYFLINRFIGSLYMLIGYFGLVVAAFFAILWLLYKNADDERLFAHLAAKAVFCGAVATALMLGLMLCFAAFFELIYSPYNSENFYLLAAVFAFAVVWVNLFLSYLPQNGSEVEVSRVYRSLVANVALPVYLLLLAILLGYIVKIIVTWTMPVGTMNWYGSVALLGYLLLWLGVRFHEGRLISFFVKYGGWAMVPVLIVQIIGVAIRLEAYGLTTARYLSLVCLALGAAVLLFTLLGRPLRPLFLAASIAALVVTITPLNAVDVPVFEQQQRLKVVLVENGMYDGDTITPSSQISDEDKEKIRSCYDYLKDNAPDPNRNEFLKQATLGNFEITYGFDYSDYDNHGAEEIDNLYCSGDMPREPLDISPYERFAAFETQASAPFNFKIELGKESTTVDLTDYIDSLVNDLGRGYHSGTFEFKPDEEHYILFTDIEAQYKNGEPDYALISGYIFYNEAAAEQVA